jgi:hypothetical protein
MGFEWGEVGEGGEKGESVYPQSCFAVVVVEFSAALHLGCGRCRHTCGVVVGIRMQAGMRKIGS